MAISFRVNGSPVTIDGDEGSLLEALRDGLGLSSVKDGCSPQGQCGCCTVWVDGDARVACVTPLRRMGGRSITTLEGLEPEVATDWAERLCDHGGSQCGFCTAGILMRLEAARRRAGGVLDEPATDRALAAHLCRCTGWQTIVEAATDDRPVEVRVRSSVGRSLEAASRRASIEGHAPQVVDPSVSLGWPGFGDDGAPTDALIAVRGDDGAWVVGETLGEARAAAAKVQGRRTTVEPLPPLAVPLLPAGSSTPWDLTLQTSWVDPAYLETDAAWCVPGGEPSDPLANGGAFGAKTTSDAAEVARRLADELGRAVRVRWSREDSVRFGVKRPPLAAGLHTDGSGRVVVARTAGIAAAIAAVLPGVDVEEVDLAGPPTASSVRAAGWAEAAVLAAALAGTDGTVIAPNGATASARIVSDDAPAGASGAIRSILVSVSCGDPLDEIVLRSYCIGAAHMALGWVTSEGLSVGVDGTVADLTIRSFGIVRPGDMPHVEVAIDRAATGPPIAGSDAVFAAVASAVWHRVGHRPVWPTGPV